MNKVTLLVLAMIAAIAIVAPVATVAQPDGESVVGEEAIEPEEEGEEIANIEEAIIEDGEGEIEIAASIEIGEDGLPMMDGEITDVEDALAVADGIRTSAFNGEWCAVVAGVCWLLIYMFRIARRKFDWDKDLVFWVLTGLFIVVAVTTSLHQNASWVEAIAAGLIAIGGPGAAQMLDHGPAGVLMRRVMGSSGGSAAVVEPEPEEEEEETEA